MFIIAGTKGKKKILGTKVISCPRCQNMAEYMYVKYSKWFTMFFIPIFPFSTKYYLVCPICGNASEMSAQQFKLETSNNEGTSLY